MRAIPAGENTGLVVAYMSEKIGMPMDPALCSAMAILDDDGVFQGGVVISEYRGHDCQISCASETPMAFRDRVCHAVFNYIFNQLGCVRCTSITRKSNKRARAFLESLGFVLEGRLRKGYDGVKDGMIYGFLKEECRYIQEFTDGITDVREAASAEGDRSSISGAEAPASAAETPQAPTQAAYRPTEQVAEFW